MTNRQESRKMKESARGTFLWGATEGIIHTLSYTHYRNFAYTPLYLHTLTIILLFTGVYSV